MSEGESGMDAERYYREVDGWFVNDKPSIQLREFRLVSRTAKGAWITDLWDHDSSYKRFVLDGDGKRFAYPTKELARASFIIRKQRQIQHATNTRNKALQFLSLAETGAASESDMVFFDDLATMDADI